MCSCDSTIIKVCHPFLYNLLLDFVTYNYTSVCGNEPNENHVFEQQASSLCDKKWVHLWHCIWVTFVKTFEGLWSFYSFSYFFDTNDIRIEDCMAWSGWVIDKWWNGEDLEVSSHGLIGKLSWKFTKGTASNDKNLNHDMQCHHFFAESYSYSWKYHRDIKRQCVRQGESKFWYSKVASSLC